MSTPRDLEQLQLSRRGFVGALGALWAGGALAASSAEIRASLFWAGRRSGSHAPVWKVFSVRQAADVEAFASKIVPSDDTPGAREAGVVHFIDHALSTWAAPQREMFLQGLEDLNRRVERQSTAAVRFAQLTDEGQIVALRTIETTPFFQIGRFFTLLGMFSLPLHGGNADLIGWRLIGFEHRRSWQPPFGYYDAVLSKAGS